MEYEVGFSADGKINALTYQFYLDGGIAGSDTLGSMYMGMQWADNAYFFPNYEAKREAVLHEHTLSHVHARPGSGADVPVLRDGRAARGGGAGPAHHHRAGAQLYPGRRGCGVRAGGDGLHTAHCVEHAHAALSLPGTF